MTHLSPRGEAKMTGKNDIEGFTFQPPSTLPPPPRPHAGRRPAVLLQDKRKNGHLFCFRIWIPILTRLKLWHCLYTVSLIITVTTRGKALNDGYGITVRCTMYVRYPFNWRVWNVLLFYVIVPSYNWSCLLAASCAKRRGAEKHVHVPFKIRVSVVS